VNATALTLGAVTLSNTEINTIDGVTAGTAAASKAVVLGASKNIATITSATITEVTATNVNATTLMLGAVTVSNADIGVINGAVAGTGAANKALVLGTGGNVSLVDGSAITVGTTNGLKLGAAANQKLGFFGVAAAVVQPANIGNTNNNTDTLASTVNGVLVALRALGLIAPTA
jgi:hypothetical protein